jgi:hypothetical protein
MPPTPRYELARDLVRINPVGKVRPCFELNAEGTGVEAALECVSCDVLFRWNREKSWWVCPVCSYELLIPEARTVIEDAHRKLKDLALAIGVQNTETSLVPVSRSDGILCRWGAWLRRLLRRKAA